MIVSEMQEKRAALVAEAEAIVTKADAEKRDMTDAEQTDFDAKMAEVDKIKKQITRAQKLEAEKAEAAAAEARTVPTERSDGPTKETRVEIPAYAGRLRGFSNDADGRRAAYNSGRFASAVLFGDKRSIEYCRENGIPMVRALNEGTNTAGGFLVPTEMEQALINLREEYGLARQLCRVRTMSSDTLLIGRQTSDLTAYAVGEASAITESDSAYDQVTLIAKKWGTLTRVSSELSDDAIIDMAQEVISSAARAHAYLEDYAFLSGDASATYQGIQGILTWFNANTSAAGYVDAASGHDTFPEIDADDVGLAMAAVRPLRARQNAVWLCSPQFKAAVFDVLQATGAGSMAEVAGVRVPTYAGYPVIESTLMPASATNNQAMALFGDFSLAVTMGNRKGITIASDASRYFEYDQVAVKTVARWDINVHDVGNTTTAGPVVALIANT